MMKNAFYTCREHKSAAFFVWNGDNKQMLVGMIFLVATKRNDELLTEKKAKSFIICMLQSSCASGKISLSQMYAIVSSSNTK